MKNKKEKSKQYGERLCDIGKINKDPIIPFDEGYEMEGYELFEENDNGDNKLRKVGRGE